ncbi:MAG TPA: hypothetical protein PLL66_04990 [Bacteroidales bacterium]|nr:hypothetical protein [Bacteroidales bacterium]
MKLKIVVVFGILSVFASSCNFVSEEKKQAAKDYHNKMIKYVNPVISGMNNLIGNTTQLVNISASGKLDSISISKICTDIDNLIATIDIYTDSLNKLEEFDSKIQYKKICMENIVECKKLLLNEYPKLIKKVSEGLTKESCIEIGEIVLDIYWKLIVVQKKSQETQLEFAKKYKFKLIGTLVNFEQVEKDYHEYEKALTNKMKNLYPDPVLE